MKKIITQQASKIETLEHEVNILKQENNELRTEINVLKQENTELKINNNDLRTEINVLKNKDRLFEALSKLNDCDKLANDTFKNEYRKYFKLRRYDNNIPNIGQYIETPPNQLDDTEEYHFWNLFCVKYPNSNNNNFRQIYLKLCNQSK